MESPVQCDLAVQIQALKMRKGQIEQNIKERQMKLKGRDQIKDRIRGIQQKIFTQNAILLNLQKKDATFTQMIEQLNEEHVQIVMRLEDQIEKHDKLSKSLLNCYKHSEDRLKQIRLQIIELDIQLNGELRSLVCAFITNNHPIENDNYPMEIRIAQYLKEFKQFVQIKYSGVLAEEWLQYFFLLEEVICLDQQSQENVPQTPSKQKQIILKIEQFKREIRNMSESAEQIKSDKMELDAQISNIKQAIKKSMEKVEFYQNKVRELQIQHDRLQQNQHGKAYQCELRQLDNAIAYFTNKLTTISVKRSNGVSNSKFNQEEEQPLAKPKMHTSKSKHHMSCSINYHGSMDFYMQSPPHNFKSPQKYALSTTFINSPSSTLLNSPKYFKKLTAKKTTSRKWK